MSKIKSSIKKRIAIRTIMNETDWSKEEVVRRLDLAEELGISPSTYLKLGYWFVPEKKLAEYHSERNRRRAIAKRVAEKHGKDPTEIERQMNEAKFKNRLRIGYFEKYEWDLLSEEERNSMFLRPQSRKMSKKFRTDESDSYIFNDKIRFNSTFPEFIRRKWFACDDMPFEQFIRHMNEFHPGYYVLKPQVSSGGKGIEKLPIPSNEEDMRHAYDHIMDINRTVKGNRCCIIEECIRQHPEMNRLYGDSVNTVRVVTLLLHGEFKVLYAAGRMGVDGNITDNASQGGMSASIDVKTGRFDTVAADNRGQAVTHHPSTGTEIKGFQIPYWDEALKMVESIARKAFDVAGLGYAGWDVAIAEDGPLIIEGNNWPSPSLLQLPKYVDHREGVRYIVDPYLDDDFEGLNDKYKKRRD